MPWLTLASKSIFCSSMNLFLLSCTVHSDISCATWHALTSVKSVQECVCSVSGSGAPHSWVRESSFACKSVAMSAMRTQTKIKPGACPFLSFWIWASVVSGCKCDGSAMDTCQANLISILGGSSYGRLMIFTQGPSTFKCCSRWIN